MNKKIKPIKKEGKIDRNKIESGVDYPVFCFRHLQSVSIKDCKNAKFFCDFLLRLGKLSEIGWNEIRTSPRHAYGMEKIPKCKIKPSIPDFITPEVEYLFVFRANGNNLPFVGIQFDSVFHVIFIETNFGDIYEALVKYSVVNWLLSR